MKYLILLVLLTGCSVPSPSVEKDRTPAGLSAEFESLERDQKFEALIDGLDLEADGLQWEYKNKGTSVGFKIKKDGKGLIKFMPKNAAANPEAQVVSYYLGRFLHMGAIVIPSAYFELKTKATAHFSALLNAAHEKNKWRLENHDLIVAEIARHPGSLQGIIVPHSKIDSMEALGVANDAANTINSNHPVAQFIRANGPLPSPTKTMALKGVKMKDGKVPVATELALAREFSEIMVLDILCGQWDRWSGGNVEATYDPETGHLYFFARDNGGASMTGLNGMQKYFGIVSRFDKIQIQRVEHLIEILKSPAAKDLISALGLRSDPKSLLARASALVEHVHDVAKQYGDAQTYFAQN